MVEIKRYCWRHQPEGEQSVVDETREVWACAICGVLNYAKKTLVEGAGSGITQEQLDAAIAAHAAQAGIHHSAFIASECDTKITTHAALPSAHHTAFVGADCDTKIATHAGIASAHHAKYTDAEARTAAVSDETYGAGWDGVTTIAPSKNAVYDKIQTIQGGDVTYLEKLAMYGSANAEWVPLIFENASPDADNTGIPAGAAVVEVSNVVYAAAQWLYGLTLPPAKNGMKLYVAANGVRYYLSAANSTNYVADGWLIGVNSAGTATTIYTDTTDRNAPAMVTFANSLTDLSSYEKVFVKLSSTQATANTLKVKFVSMLVYYGT